MAAVPGPSEPFAAELRVIGRLKSGRCRADALEPGCAGSPLAPDGRAALAPLRHDVPLLDPCCGHLSAGAEVRYGVKGRPKFIASRHAASALWVPPGFRQKHQSGPSSFSVAWSDSRSISRPSGSSDPVKVQPESRGTSTLHSSRRDEHTGPQDGFSPDLRLWTENSAAARRFRSTSATQRSYGDVCFEKLPSRVNFPETTFLADPVSERPSSRRYSSRPQLWQSIGAEWDRQQLRSRSDAKKPITFCSACPRSGHVPLYSGAIGSENMDDLDNGDADFKPLTLKRSTVPPYTPTSRHSLIWAKDMGQLLPASTRGRSIAHN